MRFIMKRLLLGFILIVSACLALLLPDLGRRTAAARSMPHVGLLQHASTMLLDEGTRGAIDGLAASGFVDGKTLQAVANANRGGKTVLVLRYSRASIDS